MAVGTITNVMDDACDATSFLCISLQHEQNCPLWEDAWPWTPIFVRGEVCRRQSHPKRRLFEGSIQVWSAPCLLWLTIPIVDALSKQSNVFKNTHDMTQVLWPLYGYLNSIHTPLYLITINGDTCAKKLATLVYRSCFEKIAVGHDMTSQYSPRASVWHNQSIAVLHDCCVTLPKLIWLWLWLQLFYIKECAQVQGLSGDNWFPPRLQTINILMTNLWSPNCYLEWMILILLVPLYIKECAQFQGLSGDN